MVKISVHLHYVWIISFDLWISYTSIGILIHLISRGLSFLTFPILALSSTLLLYAITLIILASSFYGIVTALLFLGNPSKYFLGGLKRLETGENIDDFVGDLATKANVKKPKVELVQKTINASTFGVTDDKVSLVISKDLVKILDNDELETVILHELFHAKYDVQSQTFYLIARKLFFPKYLTLIYTFFVSFVLWTVLNWPNVSFGSQSFMNARGFLYIFGGELIFSILMISILLIIMWRQGTFLTARYLYIRELLADGFSALVSKKPEKLQSAILKAMREHHLAKTNSNILSKIGFSSPQELKIPTGKVLLSKLIESKSTDKQMWVDTTRDAKTHIVIDKPNYRLPFINLIGKLLQEKCRLLVLKSDFEKMNFKPGRNLPQPVYDYARGNKIEFARFLDYSINNANHFNIIECSNHLKIHPYECLFFLWAAVNGKILDFH